jgi:lysozyme family protein
MQVNYDPFIARVIQKYEGGYGWNKSDPGGPTKYGITCYDLAAFEHLTMNSMSAWAGRVQAMPLSTAETIYSTKYATAVRFNTLPSGSDCAMLDYQINSGSRAIIAARAILNVKGSNVMDQALCDAICKADPTKFVEALCAERMRFLEGLSTWREFGGGWTSRVTDLKAYCLHLASGKSVASAPEAAIDLSHTVVPKGVAVPKTAGTPTATGAVAAGAAAFASGFPWYYIVAAVAVPLIAGIAYEAIEANKAATANATVVIPPTVVLPTVPLVPAVAKVVVAVAPPAPKLGG